MKTLWMDKPHEWYIVGAVLFVIDIVLLYALFS